MKNLFLGMALVIASMFSAQSTNVERANVATQYGKTVIGLNGTGIGMTASENEKPTFGANLTAGTFLADKLAVVGNAGYGSAYVDNDKETYVSYGAGAKYYLAGVLPLQVDWKGVTTNDKETKSFVGVQGGFAWFPFTNFSVEPTVRYDFSLRDNSENVLSTGLGFNLFF